MSNLSLLLAVKNHGATPTSGAGGESERGAFSPGAWPGAERSVRREPAATVPGEFALPSGVTSMEHWLDLNA